MEKLGADKLEVGCSVLAFGVVLDYLILIWRWDKNYVKLIVIHQVLKFKTICCSG